MSNTWRDLLLNDDAYWLTLVVTSLQIVWAGFSLIFALMARFGFKSQGFVLSGRRFITFLTIFLLNGSSGISGLVAVKLETETDLQPLFATFIILTILITALCTWLLFMIPCLDSIFPDSILTYSKPMLFLLSCFTTFNLIGIVFCWPYAF